MKNDRQKNEILTKLLTIQNSIENKTWEAWLSQAIEFIKENK